MLELQHPSNDQKFTFPFIVVFFLLIMLLLPELVEVTATIRAATNNYFVYHLIC